MALCERLTSLQAALVLEHGRVARLLELLGEEVRGLEAADVALPPPRGGASPREGGGPRPTWRKPGGLRAAAAALAAGESSEEVPRDGPEAAAETPGDGSPSSRRGGSALFGGALAGGPPPSRAAAPRPPPPRAEALSRQRSHDAVPRARPAAQGTCEDLRSLQERRGPNPNRQRFQGRRSVNVFADSEAMKKKVRENLLEPEYDVATLYKETGICQAVARSDFFAFGGMMVVVLNAIWLAVETDHNDEPILSDADPGFQVVEHLFCAIFTLEWLIRFGAFENKLGGFRDTWFLIDTVLVALMVLETWLLTLLFALIGGGTRGAGSTNALRVVRVFRLTRAARLGRLLKVVPELLVIVRGVVVVARTVFLIACVLVLIIYVFAILFTQLAKESILEDTVCSDVATTMVTLLLGGVVPDIADTYRELSSVHPMFAILFLCFVLLSYVTIMNMLIGVLVEAVGVIVSVEKETNQVESVKRVLLEGIEAGFDPDLDGLFGPAELERFLMDPKTSKSLHEVGVDTIALVDYIDHIYEEREYITFAEFLQLLLQLRGGNTAKVSDLVEMRKFLFFELRRLAERGFDNQASSADRRAQYSNGSSGRDFYSRQNTVLDGTSSGQWRPTVETQCTMPTSRRATAVSPEAAPGRQATSFPLATAAEAAEDASLGTQPFGGGASATGLRGAPAAPAAAPERWQDDGGEAAPVRQAALPRGAAAAAAAAAAGSRSAQASPSGSLPQQPEVQQPEVEAEATASVLPLPLGVPSPRPPRLGGARHPPPPPPGEAAMLPPAVQTAWPPGQPRQAQF